MHPMLYVILPGLLLAMLLYALRLRKTGMPACQAVTALLMGAVLGFVLGKGVYVLCLISRLYPRYGMGAFLRMQPTEFSFVGMMAGALLGAVVACRIHKVRLMPALDAFAPALALLAAALKGSEYCLDMHGVGAYLENESLFFFPLAVKNEWDEYFLAVFMFYCIAALLIMVLSLLMHKKMKPVPGLLFEMTIYHLAIALLLCENLRVQTIKWGFVKAEQLFGALICLAVLLRGCIALHKSRKNAACDGPTAVLMRKHGKLVNPHSALGAFWPVPALFGCAGLLIVVEFALDGKIAMPTACAYALMAAVLVCISLLWVYVSSKRLRQV